jgi:hypothetical protein
VKRGPKPKPVRKTRLPDFHYTKAIQELDIRATEISLKIGDDKTRQLCEKDQQYLAIKKRHDALMAERRALQNKIRSQESALVKTFEKTRYSLRRKVGVLVKRIDAFIDKFNQVARLFNVNAAPVHKQIDKLCAEREALDRKIRRAKTEMNYRQSAIEKVAIQQEIVKIKKKLNI